MNEKQSSNYVVSFDTFVLQPVVRESKMTTRVIEPNQEFYVPRKPIHIVRKSFQHYGGTLQVATNASKHTLGKRHKTPIIIAHDFGNPFIFLPTMSPNSEHNVWIALHAIDNIESDKLGCIVHLENNISIKLNVSATTMHRQYSYGWILKKDFHRKQSRLNRPFTIH